MAGNTFTVTVDTREYLWALLAELAQATPPHSWVLVGGAMVQLHAVRAGLQNNRLTRDIDALLDLSHSSIGVVVAPIEKLGFVPQIPSWGGGFHRFRRGEDVLDVMLSRDVRAPIKWVGHELLKTEGGAQAIQRKDTYVLVDGEHSFSIDIPDSAGAIIAKSAAHLVDRRNRERHLRDVVTLMASSPRGEFVLADLSKKDLKYLRHLDVEIGDVFQPWWLGFTIEETQAAEQTLTDIRSRL